MELCRRLLATPQRIEVATAGEKESVEVFQRVDDDILVGNGRDEIRCSPCLDHLTVVFLAEGGASVGVVCRYTYHRLVLSLRELIVKL